MPCKTQHMVEKASDGGQVGSYPSTEVEMAKLHFGERCPWSWRSISISVRARYSSVQQDGRKSPAVLSSPDVLVHQEQGLPPSWQLFLFHCWPKVCECCRVASAEKAKSGSPGSWQHSLLFHPTAWCAQCQLWQRNGLGTGHAGPWQTAASLLSSWVI